MKKKKTDQQIMETNQMQEKKGKKKEKKQKKAANGIIKIPKTVQESIPYYRVYKNGIFEIEPGKFSKSYQLEDVNFAIANQQDQESIFCTFGELLNTWGADVKIEITINNRNIDQEQFAENTLLKMQRDNLNEYREEYNQMLLQKMSEGRNNMRKEKYITLTIEEANIEAAINTFARIDGELSARIKKINNTETMPMTTVERLSVLHDLYNMGDGGTFYKRVKMNDGDVKSYDFDSMVKMGLTTKDLIGPDGLEFSNAYFKEGNAFGRTLFLDNLPTMLSADILNDMTNVSCNMVLSVHFQSLRQDKALSLIKNQMTNINSNVVDAQKRATRSGYSADLISPDLLRAQNEASRLLHDMTKKNQKLFLVTVAITHFADTLEDLNKDTDLIKSNVSKHLCQLKVLRYQQEAGFNTTLPLGYNQLEVKRLLTTESAAVFIPFSAQELTQDNGMYYGLNAVSRNLLLFNRLNSKNASGVILGTPGSGKSFSAKREMINVLLNTQDEVFIIDPEREYSPLCQLFGGEVVKISPGSDVYLNAFDMDMDYGKSDSGNEDPITLKSDFICSLCETIVGGRYGLSPIQVSIIDRCVRKLYEPYVAKMMELKKTKDLDLMPTMVDFYNLLMSQPEPEAINLATALELYSVGSLNTFAHKSNVNTNSRFVVYDIKDIGSTMKEMGLQVCLDFIWNKIIENYRQGKRTWFYIDEFYLLTQTDSSARFLQQIWKRARKWGGVPTGITQNVEDLLQSKEGRVILQNSDFILMLNQAPLDRSELAAMLHISPTQLSYITNADSGQGLIYTSKAIIPFIDKFPTDTKLYRAMTTKPDEVKDKNK